MIPTRPTTTLGAVVPQNYSNWNDSLKCHSNGFPLRVIEYVAPICLGPWLVVWNGICGGDGGRHTGCNCERRHQFSHFLVNLLFSPTAFVSHWTIVIWRRQAWPTVIGKWYCAMKTTIRDDGKGLSFQLQYLFINYLGLSFSLRRLWKNTHPLQCKST